MGPAEHALSVQGTVKGKTIKLTWRKPPSADSFNVRIDKCDAASDCYTVHSQKTAETSISITDTIYSQCTVYNIRLEAYSHQHQTIFRDETMLQKSFGECYMTENIILAVGFSLLALMIIGAGAIFFYLHRRHPIHRLTRVRSRLYSRLYSQERYQLPVRKCDLIERVEKELHNPEPFAQEYDRLERLAFDTIQRRTNVAELPSSRRRNRYNDIVPFDATRVRVLPPFMIDGDSEPSDYINASFISDVIKGTDRKYIAAQGPSDDTTPAFWHMIWQYDVRVVIMLTAVVESCGIKCNAYWPDGVGDSRKYNQLSIQLFDIAEAPNYVVRKFDVLNKSTNTSRVIVHLQYTNWPDRSAPSSPQELLQLVQLARILYTQFNPRDSESPSPLLVHCSAGVGRTGTFICVDQLMKAVDSKQTSEVDVFHTVYQLRRDRRYMVQTRAQYEFVYRCVLAYLKQSQSKCPTNGSQV